jgi:hypothetical protein
MIREVETALLRSGQRITQIHDAELVSFVIDDADFPGANGPVDIGFWLLGDGSTS